MKIEFQPQGVCTRQIIIDVENDIVNDVKFVGGCSGNTPVSYTHLDVYKRQLLQNFLNNNESV